MRFGIFLFLCGLAPLFCENDALIRVSSHEVWIDDHGIFVAKEGKMVQVPALCCDGQGLYIQRDFGSEIDIGIVWTCGVCGRWNWGADDTCRHCGAERDKF